MTGPQDLCNERNLFSTARNHQGNLRFTTPLAAPPFSGNYSTAACSVPPARSLLANESGPSGTIANSQGNLRYTAPSAPFFTGNGSHLSGTTTNIYNHLCHMA